MGDVPAGASLIPPPPPHEKSHLLLLYYGLAVVVTATTALAICNIVVIRCTTDPDQQNRLEPTLDQRLERSDQQSSESGFRYKKEGSMSEVGDHEHDCAICISVYEDGDEVRQLQRCQHTFHAPCIDMWLRSHTDCPLCRAPAIAFGARTLQKVQAENSREAFLDSAVSV